MGLKAEGFEEKLQTERNYQPGVNDLFLTAYTNCSTSNILTFFNPTSSAPAQLLQPEVFSPKPWFFQPWFFQFSN
jgi:hypothetical protein